MQPDIIQQIEPDLRAELGAAIDAAHAADAAAERATGISRIADDLLREASAEVSRLRAEQHDAERSTTMRRAECITLAIRSGSDLPPPPLPSPADGAPLAQALANFNALELAAGKLAAERDAARAVAVSAADAVRQLADAILDMDAYAVAADLVEANELRQRLLVRLCGFVRRDEKRDVPRLRQLQEDTLTRIDRRKAAIARNPLMIENHNFETYLDDQERAAEKEANDYATRLATDAQSRFEE